MKRIRLLALYGSAPWIWGADVGSALRTWENGLLRKICPLDWKVDDETYGEWRRRHGRVLKDQVAQAGGDDIMTTFLRRQFKWTASALRRFSQDVVGQTTRSTWPTLDAWSKILASMRRGSLPANCRARRAVECAAICVLVTGDEESWKLQQAIMERLAPHHATK